MGPRWEMSQHVQLRIDTGSRSTSAIRKSMAARHEREHNGLLRQYFPKGTDLSKHSADDLAAVAATLNSRPARPSAGERQQKHSTTCYPPFGKTLLRRPPEFTQYTSYEYTERLKRAGIAPSRERTGTALEGAMAESIMSTAEARTDQTLHLENATRPRARLGQLHRLVQRPP